MWYQPAELFTAWCSLIQWSLLNNSNHSYKAIPSENEVKKQGFRQETVLLSLVWIVRGMEIFNQVRIRSHCFRTMDSFFTSNTRSGIKLNRISKKQLLCLLESGSCSRRKKKPTLVQVSEEIFTFLCHFPKFFFLRLDFHTGHTNSAGSALSRKILRQTFFSLCFVHSTQRPPWNLAVGIG